MKKLISLAAFAASAVLLASGCDAVFSDVDKAYESRRVEQNMRDSVKMHFNGRGYACLTDPDEQDAYAAVDLAVKKPKSERFEIKGGNAFRNFSYILEFYRNDNPQVFWIKDDVSYSYVNNGSFVTIELKFKNDGNELAAQKSELDAKIEEILAKAPKDGSDYAKEMFVNDYLVNNCRYDDEAAAVHKSNKILGNEQDVYGALVEGKAVCEGYARAFQLLCQRLNVDCSVIEGYANEKHGDKSERSAHIWNCVRLDGDWYHTDVTWNDNTDDDLANVATSKYYFFNITDKDILKDHEISPLYGEEIGDSDFYNEFIPKCTAVKYNYFKLNCPALSSLDNAGNVVSALTKSAAAGDNYFDFLIADNLNFNDAKSKIAGSLGAEWIEKANSRNRKTNQIGSDCTLFGFEERRLITFLLKYK